MQKKALAPHQPTDAQAVPEQGQPPPTSTPRFYCSARPPMLWDTPLVSGAQLSRLCPLPAPWAPPACSLAGHSLEQFSALDAVQALLGNN